MIITFGRTAVAQCPSFTLTCALSMQEIVVLGKYYLQCLQILLISAVHGLMAEKPYLSFLVGCPAMVTSFPPPLLLAPDPLTHTFSESS